MTSSIDIVEFHENNATEEEKERALKQLHNTRNMYKRNTDQTSYT